MPLRSALFLALPMLLAACSTPPPAAPATARAAAPQAATAREQGTVLALHAVPAAESASNIVLAALGARLAANDAAAAPARVEVIVRTTDGATMAVVQRQDAALHPGEAVTIQRGATAAVAVLPAD